MVDDLQKIYDFFDLYYNCDKKTLRELSEDTAHHCYLVSDLSEAFDFDSIKNKCVRSDIASADALYFGENDKLILIEFKNGNNIGRFRAECKTKGIHSKVILRYILSYLNSCMCLSNIKLYYVVVINSTSAGLPSSAYGRALASRLPSIEQSNFIRYLTPDLIGVSVMGQSEYFDNVDVWVDTQFTNNLTTLS